MMGPRGKMQSDASPSLAAIWRILLQPLISRKLLSASAIAPFVVQAPALAWNLAGILVSLGFGIDAQYLYKTGNLFQVPQRQPHGFVIAPENIHEEAVLPGTSFYRSGFNFAQVEIAQREDAQGFEQRSCFVLE